MNLVDANVLIYAVDSRSPHHHESHDWMRRALSGTVTTLIPWVSLLAFIRLVTHPRISASPLSCEDALDIVGTWLNHPHVVSPEPDAAHSRRMRDLLASAARGGKLVNDAHLAALALQYRATVITYDSDFGRFPDVRWRRPGSSSG